MKIKKLLLSVSALALLGAANLAVAAPLKVAVVDLPSLLQSSSQISSMNQKLEKQFGSQKKAAMELREKIQGEIAKLTDTSAKLTDSEKKKLQNDAGKDQQELQSQMMKLQKDVAKAQEDAMKKFADSVNTVADQIAKKDGYDLVLLKQAMLYPKGTDITAEVVAKLPKE